MKKLYLILAFMGIAFFVKAQDDNGGTKKQQDIEALKVAFISKELNLTPEEAQKFWPVYNQYTNELRTIVKDDQDIIDRDEKVLNLRKRYRDDFTKILGPHRMNQIFSAEGKFRQLLIRSIRNQKVQRNNANRPLKRNN